MLRCKFRNKHEHEKGKLGLSFKKCKFMFLNKRRQHFSSAILISKIRIRNVVQANSVYDMLNTGLSTQS